MRRRPKATLLIGLVLTGVVVLIALVSLFWLPYPLADTSGSRLEGASALHLPGTEGLIELLRKDGFTITAAN